VLGGNFCSGKRNFRVATACQESDDWFDRILFNDPVGALEQCPPGFEIPRASNKNIRSINNRMCWLTRSTRPPRTTSLVLSWSFNESTRRGIKMYRNFVQYPDNHRYRRTQLLLLLWHNTYVHVYSLSSSIRSAGLTL
jgi:hypothetical protein